MLGLRWSGLVGERERGMNRRGFLGTLGAVAAAAWVKNAPVKDAQRLGIRQMAESGHQYIWVKAMSPLGVGDWVVIDEKFNAERISANGQRGPIGLAVKNTHPGDKTWALIQGDYGTAVLQYPFSDGKDFYNPA